MVVRLLPQVPQTVKMVPRVEALATPAREGLAPFISMVGMAQRSAVAVVVLVARVPLAPAQVVMEQAAPERQTQSRDRASVGPGVAAVLAVHLGQQVVVDRARRTRTGQQQPQTAARGVVAREVVAPAQAVMVEVV